MTRTLRPRKATHLSDPLQGQVNMYALAAAAAGVGALLFSHAAEAKIVYTPAHAVIGRNSYFSIDLNHDGTFDFIIYNTHFVDNGSFNFVGVLPNQLNSDGVEASGGLGVYFYALAVRQGRAIRGQHFLQKGVMAAQCVHGTHNSSPVCRSQPLHTVGNWINVKDCYLGLEFTIDKKVHYGWARLNVAISKARQTVTATLTGYAYETIPGKAIIAGATKDADDFEPTASLNTPVPEPATLGMLALGAPGLSIWRREEDLSDLN
jgi:hypothetical protein